MKILLTMFVLLSFSFILSGCDNKKNENIGKTSNNENGITFLGQVLMEIMTIII